MAEIVQNRLESMTEELEEMRRAQLFTPDETVEILKRRKEFENKIHSVTKELKFYLAYINYEKALLKTVKLRRGKHKIKDGKEGIDYKIIKRIRVLYEIAIQRFHCDTLLFQEFLKFCKLVHLANSALDIISVILKKHPENEEIWQIAARWHVDERKDKQTASKLLLKGLEIHKDSERLFKQLIEIELFSCTKTENNDLFVQKICLLKLEKIISRCLERIKGFTFYLTLLELFERHQFTSKIQLDIIDYLMNNHSYNEVVWDALAQRERRISYVLEEPTSGGTGTVNIQTRTPRARLEACFLKYQEGLSRVFSTTKPKLWSLYIDFLLDLQKETASVATVLKMETLKAALNDASSDNSLSERHYMAWMEIASEDVLEIAEKGTLAIPDSVELWKARMHLQIIQNDTAKINEVFNIGTKALKGKALPLWCSIVRYHYLTSSEDYINSIYQDAIKQPEEISSVLKPQYMQWLVLTKGMDAARQVYLKLCVEKPYCKELHEEMSKLESTAIASNYTAWEKVHKLATEQFGEVDVDVWINYIKFYLCNNKKVQNINDCVQRIYKQAENKLPNVLMFEFIEKYKKLMESV